LAAFDLRPDFAPWMHRSPSCASRQLDHERGWPLRSL
jgi:hypothetical protein